MGGAVGGAVGGVAGGTVGCLLVGGRYVIRCVVQHADFGAVLGEERHGGWYGGWYGGWRAGRRAGWCGGRCGWRCQCGGWYDEVRWAVRWVVSLWALCANTCVVSMVRYADLDAVLGEEGEEGAVPMAGGVEEDGHVPGVA